MRYCVNRISLNHGECIYTVWINDSRNWSLYARDIAPKVFVVIDRLFVEVEYHCKGIGTELLNRVMGIALQVGARDICVWVDMQQDPAAPGWFKKKGFVQSLLELPGGVLPMRAKIEGEPQPTTINNQVLQTNRINEELLSM